VKLNIFIEGAPKINQSIHYTRKGINYKPGALVENEKGLRAGIINSLPFEFKPLRGTIRITKLHFIFPPSAVFTTNDQRIIRNGEIITRPAKPDITDCLRGLFNAMLGTVIYRQIQICELHEVKKYFGSKPGIIIELEEINQPEDE